jgi:hypothetical protein
LKGSLKGASIERWSVATGGWCSVVTAGRLARQLQWQETRRFSLTLETSGYGVLTRRLRLGIAPNCGRLAAGAINRKSPRIE